MSAFDPELPFAFLDTGHSRIGLSILRRGSPVLEAVLNGAHRSYVNLAPPSHPSTGRIGASLAVNCADRLGRALRPRGSRGSDRAVASVVSCLRASRRGRGKTTRSGARPGRGPSAPSIPDCPTCKERASRARPGASALPKLGYFSGGGMADE